MWKEFLELFKLKNYGKTPAIVKTLFVGLGAYPLGAEIGIFIPESIIGEKEFTSNLVAEMQISLTVNQGVRIDSYTGFFCFSGEITFDDIWGIENITRFSFIWDPTILRMILREASTKTKKPNNPLDRASFPSGFTSTQR